MVVATRTSTSSSRSRRRTPGPTWEELAAAEPRLGQLLDEVRDLVGRAPDCCAIKIWFGTDYRRGGIKNRMEALVGWHAERDDPILRTDVAYRAAYHVLYDAVPPCRDCPCGAVARALFGADATP